MRMRFLALALALAAAPAFATEQCKAAGAGAVSRPCTSKARDTVSVKDFRAVGDGVTDDTAAVQACLNAGAGSAIVCEMPPTSGGYKLASLVTLAKLSTLRIRGTMTITTAGIRVPDSLTDNTGQSGIECTDSATIKLANSANVDLIANTNFATLSGSGNQFGTFRFFLRGCRLDGNKTNQTALVTTTTGTITTVARSVGGVVTITLSGATTPPIATGMTVNIAGLTNDNYSFNGRFVVQSGGNPFTYNLTAHSTIASTAATGASPTAIGYSGSNGVRIYGRSGTFEGLTIANNVLDGIWHDGVTPAAFTDDTSELESTFRTLRMINSGGDGMVFWGPQASHAYDSVDFNHGQWGREIFQTLIDSQTQGYLNTSGSLHVGAGGVIQQTLSQETSASGWGILVDNGTGPSTFSSESVACNGCIGIEFRSPNHQFQGLVQNSATGVKFNGGGAALVLNMTSNTTWFDCTSENGNVIIDVYSIDATGTVKGTSCWAGTEAIRIGSTGSAGNANARFQVPGVTTLTIGTVSYAFPNSTETLEHAGAHSITYSTSMTPAANTYGLATITATDGVAFTINAPTAPVSGHRFTLRIKNASGGALGAATFAASYKMGAAWTQPANGFSRLITFVYDGVNWIEADRSAADVSN